VKKLTPEHNITLHYTQVGKTMRGRQSPYFRLHYAVRNATLFISLTVRYYV